MSGEVIKVKEMGDAYLDQKIFAARRKAAELVCGRPAAEQEILAKIFNVLIEFKIAGYLKLEGYPEYYLQTIDALYAFLPAGLPEEEVVKMCRKLVDEMWVSKERRA